MSEPGLIQYPPPNRSELREERARKRRGAAMARQVAAQVAATIAAVKDAEARNAERRKRAKAKRAERRAFEVSERDLLRDVRAAARGRMDGTAFRRAIREELDAQRGVPSTTRQWRSMFSKLAGVRICVAVRHYLTSKKGTR